MGFPPHLLDELRNRLTLSEVVGGKVVWDARKSNPAKGDWWSPCPFHQEKTPSFHVDDRKGFYYCFGCQAKGDAVTFVMETENLSFPEAVERLAERAGLEIPRERADPQAEARRDRRSRLAEAMEMAVAAFGRAFRAGQGARARDYAAGRGLAAETLQRFEIGFAPDARGFLTEIFRSKDMLAEAVEAGLLIAPEDGGALFDRFRDRLIFPIRDARGRCIALGGRALGPNARAKYLNSPETPLFHKGRTLYNHGPAREAAGKAGQLVVAEGYMDVIALAQAGFAHAVAPLGTAITEEQLQMLWKIVPEPVIALDGDAAGLRAAHRLIDLALPLLAPGRSLQFCLMPAGQDPDDLIRGGGPAAMQAALDAAEPLIAVLWARELGAHALDTPERRAALKARLEAAAGKIGHAELQRLYRESLTRRMREHFWELDRPSRGGGAAGARGGGGRRRRAEGAQAQTRASMLARGVDGAAQHRAREAVVLALALGHPQIVLAEAEALEAMPLSHRPFEALRGALIAAAEAGEDADAAARAAAPEAYEEIRREAARHPLARPDADPDRAALVLAEAIARHTALVGREAELAEAARELPEADGEDWTWRVRQAGQGPFAAEARALRAEEEASNRGRRSRVADIIARYQGSTDLPKK
ncbi:DNA primase [Paralimibaculum aggregatum]|uniref:DNA primase n=1 Tax=Paralimibaculum aggregatum TaxID=3036245 RepID=A0ABQ6LL06_9RHOB|nr:DNA primase [Limibaculum sp. NKW23]GMG83899.1 DNA primase [Limibaculum sp. NKW23]